MFEVHRRSRPPRSGVVVPSRASARQALDAETLKAPWQTGAGARTAAPAWLHARARPRASRGSSLTFGSHA